MEKNGKHSEPSKASFRGPSQTTVLGLLSRMWDVEWLGHRSDRGGVPSAVHVLVHLLRHLLRMAKVRRGDSYSAEGGEG